MPAASTRPETAPFLARFRGSFISTLRWEQFDALWATLSDRAGHGWHVYAVGDSVPDAPLDADRFRHVLAELGMLLRREHDEDYCGIVYADDLETPTYVKVFDPHNLGVSCGFSDKPPLPGWILSLERPVDLVDAMRPTGARRRWWQGLFDRFS